MLEKIKEYYKKIKESREISKDEFLCGFFLMADIAKIENSECHLDFYNKETKKITSYKLENDSITQEEDQEIFKKEEMEMEELNLDEIKVSFEKAKEISEDLLLKRKEIPVKITVILQKQKFLMWNLIYITSNFNLINIKINAIDEKVMGDKTVSLLSFEKS